MKNRVLGPDMVQSQWQNGVLGPDGPAFRTNWLRTNLADIGWRREAASPPHGANRCLLDWSKADWS